ncbi:hypothetical protein [Streptomyces sp. CC224B]|uniref:hypothetical protein n=1 Tax=Streptomyces sp. CC224B TaxID=3044571 RepID=UPI0024A80BB5|nr:hypothetical protein [Streptomyces sp. CC224B]
MRAPSVRRTAARRITTTALCATLLLGVTGPVLALQAAAREDPPAAGAPVPEADKLLAQAEALAGLGTVLTPVTDLVTQVLKADNGRLDPEQAKKLGDAVGEAFDKLKTPEAEPPATSPQPQATPPTPDTPQSQQSDAPQPSAQPAQPAQPQKPDAPQSSPAPQTPNVPQPSAQPAQPAQPQQPDAPQPSAPPQRPDTPQSSTPPRTPDLPLLLDLPGLPPSLEEDSAYADRAIPRNLKDDTVKQLRTAVDALLKASVSGDAATVAKSVKNVVAGAVNTVVAVLLTDKLPAPNLPGLPPMPKPASREKAPADAGQDKIFSGSHNSRGH